MVNKKQNVVDIIRDAVDILVEEKNLVTKDDLKYLPTRDEFNFRMDQAMGELKTIREEISMLSQHSKDHADDISKLQAIHPNNQHPVFA